MKRVAILPSSVGVLVLGLSAACSGGQVPAGGTGGTGSGTGGSLTGVTGSMAAGTMSTGTWSPVGSGTGTGTTSTSGTASGTTTGASMTTSTGTGGPTQFTTIFTILLENHDYAEIVGSANAPYINSLIAQGGLATNYYDSGTHPSLPNYLYLISGDTQYPGYFDVDPTQGPYFPASGENLGHQMQAKNIKWRSYQESAGGSCKLSGSGSYAPKHDPFLYFTQIQNDAAICAGTNVDFTPAFANDLATGTYKYMWITPNLTSDGHDPVDFTGKATDPVGSLTTSDTWLSQHVPQILTSQAYQQGGVLFITWDEAEGRNGDDADKVPMIILSPKLKSVGFKSNTHYTHANYLATVEDILGLPRIGAAMGKQNMFEFFQ